MNQLPAATLELKICGTTSVEDATMLNGTEVDYCGILVDVAFSPRSVSISQAREITRAFDGSAVILLCNPSVQLCTEVLETIQPFALQFLCEESPDFLYQMRDSTDTELWKSIHLPWLDSQASPRDYVEAGVNRLLFDTQINQGGTIRFGGTGHTADWKQVRKVVDRVRPTPCFLAGGVHADNIRAAVAATNPAGVDLCSGVESCTGKRDRGRLNQLLRQWRTIQTGKASA